MAALDRSSSGHSNDFGKYTTWIGVLFGALASVLLAGVTSDSFPWSHGDEGTFYLLLTMIPILSGAGALVCGVGQANGVRWAWLPLVMNLLVLAIFVISLNPF